MSAAEYRESLRAYKPRVFVDGQVVDSVADSPALAPGIAAIGVTYDLALQPQYAQMMTATNAAGQTVNRMIHIDETAADLLSKLEAVRSVCQESGCAQRYLSHDALTALHQGTFSADAEHGTDYHQHFAAYLERVQAQDLTLGVAMTDAKGDRAKKPGQQANTDAYVHITQRRPNGIVIRGTKAIVTGAPYVHEFLVMPCRTMTPEDADFAVACAVPIDAPGITIVARPAGRPGEKAATFSARYGQSTAVVIFDDVFVPWDHVFMAGETEAAGFLTTTYATHHRHSCIGARAGFGDLLIGAGALMIDANGLDPARHSHIRDQMVELITMVEGFYACGVAASTYATEHPSGTVIPDAVFANIGKLLLANQIYDMHRVAHYVSGGLIVALPGPDEDHNPETAAALDTVLGGRSDIPTSKRLAVSRMVEDLTASYQGGWYSIISLHGGGSPEAMKREIWRNYPIPEKTQLVENLLDRGVSGNRPLSSRQPGKCCATGCQPPALTAPPAETTSAAAASSCL
ncbi:4-hydroxyphenylacetate 3-hydroxylase family protein [Smaragdicoccus niigatensis]|uniref:4-hydroxyphenylacetate 3-hydroxylase family protein n=1 Tax=Smaragdicoccus niigatensis TaxID=359359 RepID=UPI000374CB91|nr:4-hydroxyphenylacetate 3-hydroxylase N-terminal domain-containing protein [Smaragdicoccus niigatensis]